MCGQRKRAENENSFEQTSNRPKRCTGLSRNCVPSRIENMAVKKRDGGRGRKEEGRKEEWRKERKWERGEEGRGEREGVGWRERREKKEEVKERRREEGGSEREEERSMLCQ